MGASQEQEAKFAERLQAEQLALVKTPNSKPETRTHNPETRSTEALRWLRCCCFAPQAPTPPYRKFSLVLSYPRLERDLVGPPSQSLTHMF